jgi:dCTP deaminase
MLCDKEISELNGMILPFVDHQVRQDNKGNLVISYGLSSTGYDMRLGTNFRRPRFGSILDPKHIREDDWSNEEHFSAFLLEPKSFILGQSVETFNMPDDIMAICTGKSKLARIGEFPNITPLESGWKGILTIELANLGLNPIYVYPNEGIAQILFFRLSQRPMVTYADRSGVFQNQVDVTLSKL